MRRTLSRLAAKSIQNDRPPIIRIANGTFYRQHPNTSPPFFPGLNFTLPAFSSPVEKWGVLSKSSTARTTFLQILRGQHICLPPTTRSYPYLSSDEIATKDQRLRSAHNAVQYVGFDAERGQSGGSGMRGAYLSARYESLREDTDFSLVDFLMGNTELNPDERLTRHPDQPLLERVMRDLRLAELAEMPVTHLSNGQTRRAKIAKALLSKPEVLLLDGPFMGLDPPTLNHLSAILGDLAEAQSPRLVLSLKPDEHIPQWITHVAFVTQNFQLGMAGPRNEVIRHIHKKWEELKTVNKITQSRPLNEESVEFAEVSRHLWAHTPSNPMFEDRRAETAYHREYSDIKKELATTKRRDKMFVGQEVISRDGFRTDTKRPEPGEAIIEMNGVKVQYGDKAVLGNWKQHLDGEDKYGLWWDVRRGERWGVFGPNGSGKTTLISLITSDHPQTYSLPIKLFGRPRLPQPGQPGISIFDLQQRIGHSSPEVHVFFPKYLSLRRTIESAWADTPLTRPKLTYDIDEKVNAALMWFRAELVPLLGASKWMRAEMDRAVTGVDNGFFVVDKKPADSERAAYHLRLAERAISEEQQEMEGEDWADNIKFGELSFSAQRVALFIRAVIRSPDLVILDEAFSGMDDFARDKCHLFLSHGENAMFHLKRMGSPINSPKITRSDLSRLGMSKIQGLQDRQALIVISHKKEEVPGCVRNWICLPESGHGVPRLGRLGAPLELASSGWKEIWGEKVGMPGFHAFSMNQCLQPSVERTLEERREKTNKRIALLSREDWPDETPEQRTARRARRDAYIAEAQAKYKVDISKASLDERKQRASRKRTLLEARDLKTYNERRRIQARLHCAAESPEEKKRRLTKERIRWTVRMESMKPEERLLYHRERNQKYLNGRPDRVERHKELDRQASDRRRKRMTDEDKAKRNAQAREKRMERVKAMTEEELEKTRRARREKHSRRLAEDPEYARNFKAKMSERMGRYRKRLKEVGEADLAV
jgi:ABC-type molybdenum transport system ATPase subunit/photorepair protein PhrA